MPCWPSSLLSRWELLPCVQAHIVLGARYDGGVDHAVLGIFLLLVANEVIFLAKAHGRGDVKSHIWQVLGEGAQEVAYVDVHKDRVVEPVHKLVMVEALNLE